MYYYKKIDKSVWQPHLYSLCKSQFNDFPLKEFYEEITADEYIKLMDQCPTEIIDSVITFNNLNDMIVYIYKFLYPQIVKDLIHKGHLTYKWEEVENFTHMNDPEEVLNTPYEYFQSFNEYINQSRQENITNLAKDILVNGMYFPFYGYNNFIGYGGHRIVSLKKLKEIEPFDTKFLYIMLPVNWTRVSYYQNMDGDVGSFEEPMRLPMVDIENKKIYFITTVQYDTLWMYFSHMSDKFGDKMFHVREKIKPHFFFNNQEAFEEFLNADI